jgi:hypothetical protein
MKAQLNEGKYYIASVDESRLMSLYMYLNYIMGIFRERDGISIVIQEDIKEETDAMSEHELLGPFSMIGGEGLIKAIGSLEKKGIECRLHSTYNHDYLFVPFEKREDVMKILEKQKIGVKGS